MSQRQQLLCSPNDWRKQTFAQLCAFSSPFCASMSEIAIFHQLADSFRLPTTRPECEMPSRGPCIKPLGLSRCPHERQGKCGVEVQW